jgi:hypothetical protein
MKVKNDKSLACMCRCQSYSRYIYQCLCQCHFFANASIGCQWLRFALYAQFLYRFVRVRIFGRFICDNISNLRQRLKSLKILNTDDWGFTSLYSNYRILTDLSTYVCMYVHISICRGDRGWLALGTLLAPGRRQESDQSEPAARLWGLKKFIQTLWSNCVFCI